MEKNDPTAAATLVKELLVLNKMGIHARPAAMIVRVTNKFKSDVFVEKDEEQVNGKSIMGLMMLAAAKGSKIKFLATGEDADKMLAELEALFAKNSKRPKPGTPLLRVDPAGLDRLFWAQAPSLKKSRAFRVVTAANCSRLTPNISAQ